MRDVFRWMAHAGLVAVMAVGVVGCDDDEADPADTGAGGTGGTVEDLGGAGGEGGEGGMGGGGDDMGAGGMGGMVEVDMTVEPDMAVEGDMAIEPDMMIEADMGMVEPLDCQQTCFRAGFCAAQDEPENLCAGLWFVDVQRIVGACVAVCNADPDFATDIAAAGFECGASVDRLEEDATFAGLCADGFPSPPAVAECEARGAKIASCLVADCPNAGPIEAGTAELLALGCNGAVAQGAMTPEMAGMVNAETGCDDMAVTETIAELRATGRRATLILPLETLCADGALLTEETCTAVCDNTVACAPPGSILESFDACFTACLPTSAAQELGKAECAAEAIGCQALADCYTGR